MARMSRSLSTILGVVPQQTMEWYPEIAPQEMVMNRKGHTFPGITGPLPWMNSVTAGILRTGLAITIPATRSSIVPTLM